MYPSLETSTTGIAKTLYQFFYFSQDSIVLGGTHQHADWDTEARKEDHEFIWEGCSALRPAAIEGSGFIRDWVGLRPGRTSVRLERDKVSYREVSYDASIFHRPILLISDTKAE